jgi:hypothetical protein
MKCARCHIEKSEGDFYSKDRTCKTCRRALVRAHREANAEYYKAYDKARANRPDRVQARADYIKTEAGKQAKKRAQANWLQRNPEWRAAQVAVGNAVRDGKLTPWPVCLVPTCSRKPEAHHPDYSRPLDVVWLCPAHHKQAHALVEG